MLFASKYLGIFSFLFFIVGTITDGPHFPLLFAPLTQPLFSFFKILFFQLQLIVNVILYYFLVYSIMFIQSYALQSVPPDVSNTHLALYTACTVPLTIFPTLYFTSVTILQLLICTSYSLHFFHPVPQTSPLRQL